MNIKTYKGTGDKNILILSGVHGDELTPIVSTNNLIKNIETFYKDKKEFHARFGSLKIFSAINATGIAQNTREIPNDFTPDLNRKFNTRESFEDELFELINDADMVIDVHSSPNCTNFVLLNQDENTNSFVDFCNDNYIEYAIQYSAADTIKNYCLKNDKIGITVELNGKNYIDTKASEIGVSIILKFIIHDLEIKKSVPKHNVMEEFKTYHEGLFIFNKECGNIINDGDYMGYVLNLNDFSEIKIYFTKKGSYRMICRDRSDYVSPNKIICMLQPLI